jgi:phospholipase C
MLSSNAMAPAFADSYSTGKPSAPTTTPIKYVVVIFGENISFDHYFATYPFAANTGAANEPNFKPRPHTPSINGIGTLNIDGTKTLTGSPPALPLEGDYATANDSVSLSSSLAQSGGAYSSAQTLVQPFRLSYLQATTCDMDHNYTDEQVAYHSGQNDLFIQKLGCTASSGTTQYGPSDKSAVMGYFDGNVVQGLWNYAQHFAMNDNAYDTMYGPSSPGAIDLISGNNHGIVGTTSVKSGTTGGVPEYGNNQTTGAGEYENVTVAGGDVDVSGDTGGHDSHNVSTMIGDIRPLGDDCNPTGSAQGTFGSSGKNVGDLLNAKGVTWGWFHGGFHATVPYSSAAAAAAGPLTANTYTATSYTNDGRAAVCGALHMAADGTVKVDYIGHHQPFQYYTSTQNLHHLPPASNAEVGKNGPANHQYDVSDLFSVTSTSSPTSQTYTVTGLKPGVTLPAVTYIKAPGFMDGHPQYSNPILEQQFDIEVINALMRSPYWPDMAIIITYDDSDGWYDHVVPPLVNPSNLSALSSSSDGLTGNATGLTPSGACGVPAQGAVLGRCGYGPRMPFLVISPWSRVNYVDHTIIDQTSILRFIEDNWNLGRIDPTSKPVSQGGSFDQIAGSLYNMFDFTSHHHPNGLILNTKLGSVGTVVSGDDDHFFGDEHHFFGEERRFVDHF